jgi:hypothetical protein
VFFQAGLRAGRRNLGFPGNHLPMSYRHSGASDCRYPAYRCGGSIGLALAWPGSPISRFTRRALRRTPEKSEARLATADKAVNEIRQRSTWPPTPPTAIFLY